MELNEVSPSKGVHRSFFISNYNRYIDFQFTVFGGIRICLTSARTKFSYELNWCIGKEQSIIPRALLAIEISLAKGIELPFCSHIKPLYNDDEFLNKIADLTGIRLVDKKEPHL